ncbi:MAG TPA: hypothetical protein VGK99_24095 [Acidobacteriota bacterium]|jgi:hypothetical protein
MKNEYANMAIRSLPGDSDGVLAQRMRGGDEAALDASVKTRLHRGRLMVLGMVTAHIEPPRLMPKCWQVPASR